MQNKNTEELILTKLTELLELVREFRAFLSAHHPAENQDPQHADMWWVMDHLGIGRTTFYVHVRNQLLQPVMKIGRREYYNKADVYALARRAGGGNMLFPQK